MKQCLKNSNHGYVLSVFRKGIEIIMGLILYDIMDEEKYIEINLLCGRANNGISAGSQLLNLVKSKANNLKYSCRLNSVPSKIKYYEKYGFKIENYDIDPKRMCIIYEDQTSVELRKNKNVKTKKEYSDFVETYFIRNEIPPTLNQFLTGDY